MALMRICDEQGIPYATNIATAEVLIRGLEQENTTRLCVSKQAI
jgi:methylglyoxal synthase